MAMWEKIKNFLKKLVWPFTLLAGFVLTGLISKFSKDSKRETKKEISDLNKDISSLEKNIKSTQKEYDKKAAELENAVDKTQKVLDKNLSDKKIRDKTAEKFFK